MGFFMGFNGWDFGVDFGRGLGVFFVREWCGW